MAEIKKLRAKEKHEVFVNREFSWLLFNERVLEEAENKANPPFERMRFLGIFMSNLDEFYRVRVGMLYDQLLLDDNWKDAQTGTGVVDQLRVVWKRTRKLITRFDAAYAKAVSTMRDYGLVHIGYEEKLSEKDLAYLRNIFKTKVAPAIMPFVVEKENPLPFFENEQQVVGVTLRTKNGNTRFGFIAVPDTIDRIVKLPGNSARFILTEELILLFAHRVFHKFVVEGRMLFSVIRSADIDEKDGLYDYDKDFADTMSKIIDVRNVMPPIMLKYHGHDVPKLLSYLSKALFLKKKQFFQYETPLAFGFLSEVEPLLTAKTRRKILYKPHKPAKNAAIDTKKDVFDQIVAGDELMSYPFESITSMVTLLAQAAADSRVTAISMSLYRVSKKSKIVAALIAASQSGKKVTVVIELRARFDEENNIDLAEQLQGAGVNVLYGLPDYKVHSKLLLIEHADGRRVALVGTGNFNEVTAQFYTDVALMTAHAGITADVREVFDAIEEGRFVEKAQHLLVSPLLMKPRLLDLIDEEIDRAKSGQPAGIIMKMNSLTEKEMMEKLVEASKAGVEIDLIIRGICCLVAGVAGETEHIRVRSIVGRYLEHSRIFAFGAGRGRARKYFISSADLMTRNLTGRVEVATPVYDKKAREKLRQILDACLSDNINARVQKATGKYVRVKFDKNDKRFKARDSQALLAQEATDAARAVASKK